MSVYAKAGHSGELQPMRTAPLERVTRRYATGGLLVEKFAKVAAVYGAAKDAGRPTTKAVADAFDVTPAAARRLVARTRKAGLLPPVV